jgi:glucose/mannose-6-phosphate isomerase
MPSETDFRQSILSLPEQFTQGLKLAENVRSVKDFSQIVISGMGGSALPGEILDTYQRSLTRNKNNAIMRIHRNRSYKLPPEAFDDCLNIICSYSGNTEETVSSFQEALVNNLNIIAISSGGLVEKMALKNGVPHIKLPKPSKDFQPRMAVGYFFFALIQILINERKLPDLTAEITDSAQKLNDKAEWLEKNGKEFSEKLHQKTPLIYSSNTFSSLAMIWKIKFNENTKIPAFFNVFPELNHNEFIGFTNPQTDYFIIMLRDPEDDPRNLKRYDLTAKFLAEKNISGSAINLSSENIFFKIFSNIILADWTSYYLALHYQTDPNAVPMIEEFKKELNTF